MNHIWMGTPATNLKERIFPANALQIWQAHLPEFLQIFPGKEYSFPEFLQILAGFPGISYKLARHL